MIALTILFLFLALGSREAQAAEADPPGEIVLGMSTVFTGNAGNLVKTCNGVSWRAWNAQTVEDIIRTIDSGYPRRPVVDRPRPIYHKCNETIRGREALQQVEAIFSGQALYSTEPVYQRGFSGAYGRPESPHPHVARVVLKWPNSGENVVPGVFALL
jgi:hypothetical protein